MKVLGSKTTRTALAFGLGCSLLTAVMAAPVVADGTSSHDEGGSTGAVTGTLYYTEFQIGSTGASPSDNVRTVTFSYDGTSLQLNPTVGVAAVNMADGLAWAPNGDLLVGGQITSALYQVNPTSGAVATAALPDPYAYHVAVDPSGQYAYTGAMPGILNEVPLNPLGSGTEVALHGDDTAITGIAFDAAGNAYYTASNAAGDGDFGTLDMTTFTTHRVYSGLPAAHGITFDKFTGDLILTGAQEIAQIDPSQPGLPIVSTYSVTLPTSSNPYYDVLDQGSTDGQGHLFAASNDGTLVFIDYSKTGLVGSSANVVQSAFLDNALDDVLAGPVSAATCSRDPDSNGDVHSNDHNGHGEDVSADSPGNSGSHMKCDPDSNGDLHSNNHNGHGED